MKTTPANLDLLATFVAVAEAQSFSRAARALGVTKGTVSRGVQRLERAIGAELLHRDTHRVMLSDAGAALYERSAPALRSLREAACAALPTRDEEPAGELRVATTLDFGRLILPELVARFSLRYPKVRFDLRVSNTRVDLLGERIDVAIRAAPERITDARFAVRRLGSPEVRLYAAPSSRGSPRRAR
jgi:DNA-binding transcriptional LysR family regulator